MKENLSTILQRFFAGEKCTAGDYYRLVLFASSQINKRYHGLGDSLTEVKSPDGQSISVTSEVLAIINDTIRKIADKKDVAPEAHVSYFSQALRSTLTDYFRSGDTHRFARTVDRHFSDDTQYLQIHRKDRTFFENQWGGRDWEKNSAINCCPWVSIYHSASPLPMWEVISADGSKELSKESQIICMYGLYLLQIDDTPQYMKFTLLYEVIENEFHILKTVGSRIKAPESEKEIDITDEFTGDFDYIRPEDFDPMVVSEDIEDNICDSTDQFILYCSSCGYTLMEIESIMQRAARDGLNVKVRKHTFISERLKIIDNTLRELDYSSVCAKDVICDIQNEKFAAFTKKADTA